MDTENRAQVLRPSTSSQTRPEESRRPLHTTRNTQDHNRTQPRRPREWHRSNTTHSPGRFRRPFSPRSRYTNSKNYAPFGATRSRYSSEYRNQDQRSYSDIFNSSSSEIKSESPTNSMYMSLSNQPQQSTPLTGSRLSDDILNMRINMIQEGKMICQICEKVVQRAEASDGKHSQRCCIECARRWSINTSKKITYQELEGTRTVKFDEYDRKVSSKKPINPLCRGNSYQFYSRLKHTSEFKNSGLVPENWSELEEDKRKLYELLYAMLKAE